MEVIKFREVGIAIEVKRSDAGDVSPVAMFVFAIGPFLSMWVHFFGGKWQKNSRTAIKS